jgi:hypothetical protein
VGELTGVGSNQPATSWFSAKGKESKFLWPIWLLWCAWMQEIVKYWKLEVASG